uniref:Uncharacterized protein n=1 Tax=Oryza rufipogon TaxID=4529 RepID=A0A0E0P5Z5_ORYRU
MERKRGDWKSWCCFHGETETMSVRLGLAIEKACAIWVGDGVMLVWSRGNSTSAAGRWRGCLRSWKWRCWA